LIVTNGGKLFNHGGWALVTVMKLNPADVTAPLVTKLAAPTPPTW